MATQSRSVSANALQGFYTLAAWAAAGIVVLGFAKTYYLKALFGTPTLSPLFHIHGLIMSLWIVLFVVQTQLVASHKIALHRKLGMFGGLVLLSCLGILGAAIARIPLEAITKAGPLAFFGLTDLLILICIAYDRIKTRRFHPAFVWGGLFIFLSHPLRLMLGGTGLWMRFATWLTS